MTKLKLNVIIIPLNSANESTSEIDPLVCKRFLHLEDPTIDLNELKERIETRCQRLYPDEDKISIEGFQDTHLCDLDPDYCISDVFSPGDILRAIIRNQFKSQSLSISNTSLQGTRSPPLLQEPTIITGATEIPGSHKRSQELFDNSDNDDSAKHSTTNNDVPSFPQPREHIFSAREPLKPRAIKVPRKKKRESASPSNDKGSGGSTAPDVVSIPGCSPIISMSTPSSSNRFEQAQNSQMSCQSTETTQSIIPATQPQTRRYAPGNTFHSIVSALPNFQYDSATYTYNYKGHDVLSIIETIEHISLWFSPSYRACRFPCNKYSEGCRAYISLSNDETPELEWKYDHNHDCLSDQYFVDNNEELKMQKFILEHYLELDWEDQRIKYCENFNRSNLLTFESCY
ncbi:uncharacterized protein J8A68_002910, partial [[Candida] subhashii]